MNLQGTTPSGSKSIALFPAETLRNRDTLGGVLIWQATLKGAGRTHEKGGGFRGTGGAALGRGMGLRREELLKRPGDEATWERRR